MREKKGSLSRREVGCGKTLSCRASYELEPEHYDGLI